jgi:hypothetical protein
LQKLALTPINQSINKKISLHFSKKLFLYFRRYGTKCAGCSQGISPNDLVRRARNKVFHLKCFTCMICRKQLSTGEELYIMDENRFICKEDYINSKLQGKKKSTIFLKSRFFFFVLVRFWIVLRPIIWNVCNLTGKKLA